MQRLVEVLNTSTNPAEIQQAQLMMRELMGQNPHPEEQEKQEAEEREQKKNARSSRKRFSAQN